MESLGCAGASEQMRGFARAFGPSPAKEDTRFQDARSPVARSWLHLASARRLWADLVASPFPPPLPNPLPGCGLLPCVYPARGWDLRQRQGEGEEKAGRCRTPLPSAFVRHRFPSQPWEQLAGRCSSSRAASSSPSACFGWCLSAPSSTSSFPPRSRSSLGWLQPGSTSLGHPQHLLPGCGGRPGSLCPSSGTDPCWQWCSTVPSGSCREPLLLH